MLDPQLLRAEAESVAERLTVKKYILDVDKLGSLEEQRKGFNLRCRTFRRSVINQRKKSVGARQLEKMYRP